MAGYVVNLNSKESLEKCIHTGTYSTRMSSPSNYWRMQHEGTFADYLSMKAGDNIYFFIDRKIYGVGKIINISDDCKYLNFKCADIPNDVTEDEYNSSNPILDYCTKDNRCFCTFEPSPFFFMKGIDMDDVLNSNPSSFRSLRAFWKVSFIKIDDEENKALKNIILKRNEDFIYNGKCTYSFDKSYHKIIEKKITKDYILCSNNILEKCAKGNKITHEMAIETALCEKLSNHTIDKFGPWDYISHQVIASPLKPIDYMDKMDVFGYRYIVGYDAISKYLIIEIKKDDAVIDVINQVMKYVDWVQTEYAHGDYSMIEAYVVASGFSEEVIKERDAKCIRYFTKGFRPSTTEKWTFVKLVKYKYEKGKLIFEFV